MVQTKKDIKVCPGGQIPTIDGSEADVTPSNCMSALPPKADMCSATRDVRFVPKADMEKSLRETKRPPRGGLSGIRSGVLIRMLASACAIMR